MGNIDGKEDKDSGTRAEEERLYAYAHAGRGGNVGCQSQGSGNQQKRIDRENSQKPSIFSFRISDIGGMLRQLISDYRDQVAKKKHQIQRIEEEKQRLNDETQQLEARIQEFEALQEDLEKQLEESL